MTDRRAHCRVRPVTGKSRVAFLLLAAGILAFSPAPRALGHVRESPDEILKQIGVDENLGGQVPPEILLLDEAGKTVRLGDSFGKGPVVLTLNYYTCPMLCPLALRSLLEAANGTRGVSLSRDFRIVTVSIDPEEKPAAVRARAAEMHAMMKGIGVPGSRWAFYYAGGGEIEKLTAAVGFRYRKVGEEFAHPDVAVVLTSGGKVSRYLYGVSPGPEDLRMALIEAARGRIGESAALHRALLFCFRYDPVQRKYALYARNIMKAGGVFTLVFLGVLYLALWKRRRPGTLPGGSGDR